MNCFANIYFEFLVNVISDFSLLTSPYMFYFQEVTDHKTSCGVVLESIEKLLEY